MTVRLDALFRAALQPQGDSKHVKLQRITSQVSVRMVGGNKVVVVIYLSAYDCSLYSCKFYR
jgi:hypothetical protein